MSDNEESTSSGKQLPPNFACVRFLDKVIEYVGIEDILNFDPSKIKYNKKYSIKWKKDGNFYPGEILKLDYSLEKLKQKRIVIPTKAPSTASSSSDGSSSEDTHQEKPPISKQMPIEKVKKKNSAGKENSLRILNLLDSETNLRSECIEEEETHREIPLISKQMLVEKVKKKNGSGKENLRSNGTNKVLEEKSYWKEKELKYVEKIKILKEKTLKLKKRNEELTELNDNLQNEVINKFKNFNPMVAPEPMPLTDVPPVASRADGKVHLGRGVYLPITMFDNILQKTRSAQKDGLFIKEVAIAVYGNATLAESSVTGAVCNRFQKAAKPALDPTKLMAICDILEDRLIQRGESQERINKILASVNTKVGEKIQDLNRGPRPSKLKENRQPVVREDGLEVEGRNELYDLENEIKAAQSALDDGEDSN